jgi:hypothetical protein
MGVGKVCGFGGVGKSRKAEGNFDYKSVMLFCLALVASIMVHPAIARATKDR